LGDANDRRDGCTTDKVIENIKTKLGSGDELDGFGELRYPQPPLMQRANGSEEDQNVVREAIERGSSNPPTSQGCRLMR
jgi:hypothetical protein